MFRFPSPDRQFFWKSKKKKKNSESLVKKQSRRSYLINTSCLKLSSILCFCSLFRHLIVLLIYIFYHLIISCRLNVRFNMQSCVHSFIFFFARPTDPPSREGVRWETRHILWGWPNQQQPLARKWGRNRFHLNVNTLQLQCQQKHDNWIELVQEHM